jgi:hypothetical protein
MALIAQPDEGWDWPQYAVPRDLFHPGSCPQAAERSHQAKAAGYYQRRAENSTRHCDGIGQASFATHSPSLGGVGGSSAWRIMHYGHSYGHTVHDVIGFRWQFGRQNSGRLHLTKENEHTANLRKARERLVEDRRQLAADLAKPFKRDDERKREIFTAIQSTIDAIDQAIEDERSNDER